MYSTGLARQCENVRIPKQQQQLDVIGFLGAPELETQYILFYFFFPFSSTTLFSSNLKVSAVAFVRFVDVKSDIPTRCLKLDESLDAVVEKL